MIDYVIDTNAWVFVDKDIDELDETGIACVEACYHWLRTFVESQSKLVIDASGEGKPGIFWEYRRNVVRGGQAERWLNALKQDWMARIQDVVIAWDENNHAILPDALRISDRDDRKFVAVAMEYGKDHPTPPIVYAADTDWRKEREKLEKGGIVLHELCPAYIDAHYAG